jgi:hypothetical protein
MRFEIVGDDYTCRNNRNRFFHQGNRAAAKIFWTGPMEKA